MCSDLSGIDVPQNAWRCLWTGHGCGGVPVAPVCVFRVALAVTVAALLSVAGLLASAGPSGPL